MEVSSLGDGKRRTSTHSGRFQKPEEFTEIYRYCRQSIMATMWFDFLALEANWS